MVQYDKLMKTDNMVFLVIKHKTMCKYKRMKVDARLGQIVPAI